MAKVKVQIEDRSKFFRSMADKFDGTDIGTVCNGIAGSLEVERLSRRQTGCDIPDYVGENDSYVIAAVQASVRLMLKGQQVFSVEHMALSGYMAWCEKELPDRKP